MRLFLIAVIWGAVLFFAAGEVLAWRVGIHVTFSETAWRLQDQLGWWATAPLVSLWLLLGSHLFVRVPH